jgi:predicted enzyme related to lactoylglutathione lyase
MIKHVAFFAYPVTDVARARAFYEGFLALKVDMAHEIPNMPGVWWIEYDVAGATIAISNAWAPSGQSGPGVAFEVDDLDAFLQQAQSAQVTVAFPPMDSPICRFFGIKDPDGNDITIHQAKHLHA